MTDLDPQDPADALPRGARAARTTGRPAPLVPPRGAGGKTSRPGEFLPGTPGRDPLSPKDRERADPTGTPGPETAAAPLLPGHAAVRAGAQDPAGGALEGARGAPAGSTTLSAGQMAIAKAMSEDRGPDSLDAHVRRLMDDLGLWGYHPLNSIGSRRGWPDWTIIGSRIIYRELKTERGTLRPDQALVRDLILAADGDWALWRPTDLLSGRIAAELAAISGLRIAGGAA